jgi:hypothetical protein
MAQSKPIEYILRDIKTLDYKEKIEILEQLVRFLRRPATKEPKRKPSLLELEGLGKEIWMDTDVDDFIEEERNSWN